MTWFWNWVASLYDRLLRPLAWSDRQIAITEGITGRVLEVGCGTAHLTLELLRRDVDAYGLDLSPEMIAQARNKQIWAKLGPSRFCVADAQALPFADRCFDYVLATGVLGLLSPPVQPTVIREMARVCRSELRLLEPLEERPGFYPRRALTFCLDGMRPIPPAFLNEAGLTVRQEWRTMWGMFSFIRAWQEPAA